MSPPKILLELVNEFNKFEGYKINIQKFQRKQENNPD